MKQTRSLSEFSCMSEYTRLNPITSMMFVYQDKTRKRNKCSTIKLQEAEKPFTYRMNWIVIKIPFPILGIFSFLFHVQLKTLEAKVEASVIPLLIGKIRHGIGKKGGYFWLGMGPKFGP